MMEAIDVSRTPMIISPILQSGDTGFSRFSWIKTVLPETVFP